MSCLPKSVWAPYLRSSSVMFFCITLVAYKATTSLLLIRLMWGTFLFSPFLIFLRQQLTFHWTCFQFKKFWESIIETGKCYHGVATYSCRQFTLSFSLKFLSVFMHISGSTLLITLLWVLLERSFHPAELEYRWCQFWSKMTASEVKQRPMLVTAGCSRHKNQCVNPEAYHLGVCFWLNKLFFKPFLANECGVGKLPCCLIVAFCFWILSARSSKNCWTHSHLANYFSSVRK